MLRSQRDCHLLLLNELTPKTWPARRHDVQYVLQLNSMQVTQAQLSSAQLSSDRVDPKSPGNVRQAQDKHKENSSAPPLFLKAVAVEVAVRASQKSETAKTGAQLFGIASTTRMA